jgi:uncharacterized membrane protein YjgN (DUF898 family)
MNSERISFTGTGSEYFRIWIVNMLLIFVTVGLYGPWAKVRREKFFHQHTVIGGASLDFHGNPIAILIGRAIAYGLVLISWSQSLGAQLAAVAGVLIALLLPLLMQRSLRFRLANTSYRGLRFRFSGTTAQAYQISWPYIALSAIALLGPFIGIQFGMPNWIIAASPILIFLIYPALHGMWRRYSIDHAHFGSARLNTDITGAEFTKVYISAGLWGILFLFGALAVGILALLLQTSFLIPLIMLLGYAGTLIYYPIVWAKLQNLCWNKRTHILVPPERVASFVSDLSIAGFVKLQLKNFFLTVITAGLYRPFAAVASSKMRLEAISISDLSFLDHVIGSGIEKSNAVGNEALDLLDIDFSL